MARIAGVELPDEKRIEVSLSYVYGIGPSLAKKIMSKVNIDSNKRTQDLTDKEVTKITKELENYTIEGDLMREVTDHIKRLQEIQSYRGLRHLKNLPVRGQRTRTNARTKRGKRVTIGTVRREIVAKMGVRAQSGPKATVKK
ncbi:30S ribosomal protein S13 [Candidatus Curtissbacteria bacterium RBG_16_39_7]|uniref:Small ribosomal subunit protein uS13 n=1 Tax=Candidatus Curtissbacteria bacterium RBG_16_39_7 TaxID=1797707 RepID=A0A1F5G1J1_9BACT|nr:MAG: 30S ribosomal protein S13 [Candidatus Curtissbacteria bacterium RBG_16_39_7]